LREDVVVRLRKVQVIVDGKEESAVAVFVVSDGIDRCRVGFLPRHLLKHIGSDMMEYWHRSPMYTPNILQVLQAEGNSTTTRVAAIISTISEDAVQRLSHKKRRNESDDDSSGTKRQRTATEADTSHPT
jgi:hypothetical protein